MTYKEVNTMLSSVGIPYAYNQFDNDTPQEPPFICFLYDHDDDLIADNTNYQLIRMLSVELYTDTKDFELEQTVEDVLNVNGLVYSKQETYLESERMYMITFEADVVITKENDNA